MWKILAFSASGQLMTVFRILAGRGQIQTKEVIGRGYLGIVNTDRYPGYHWIAAHRRQLCWAHLKREFLAIKERGGVSAEVGAGLLEQVKEIFETWRALKAGSLSREEFQQQAADLPQPPRSGSGALVICRGAWH